MSLKDGKPDESYIEPLTRREREILALLDQGHTAPEIAQQLTLAVSSVKWHIQQLYGKLGVNSKRQALTRAQELGILDNFGSAIERQPPLIRPFARQHNLPLQVTRFFGREAEISQVKIHLAEHRLVTLTGSGGVGKTRLGLRAAAELLSHFRDGVWFVELAALTEPALVAQQVASKLGLPDESGRPILETLIFFLRDRQVLLVLDNCEHLLETCSRLAEALLRACPRLTLLATSRAPLGIDGEAIFLVPSLPVPNPTQAVSPEILGDFAAVRLFADRARLVLPDYAVAPHNASFIAAICQRLDGIPLALELAAARMNTLSAEQLAGRLDDAFSVLANGRRTALPRHQTLRATMDWSYQLLNEQERLLLQRLSTFAGSWTLEAAEAVCSGEELAKTGVLDGLSQLVAKSMVIADRQPGTPTRYRLLETVRQYAGEKLESAGEHARLRTRHRDYFLAFTERAGNVAAKDRPLWTRLMAAERENLRLALDWSFSDLTDVEAGPRLVLRIFLEDMMSGIWASFQEGQLWYGRAVALCQSREDISPRLRAHVFSAAASMLALNDPPAAVALARQAVAASRLLGPEGKDQLIGSLSGLGWRYMEDMGQAEQALPPYGEMEALLDELGPERLSPERYSRNGAWLAFVKAKLAEKQGQYQDAQQHASESVRLWDACSDPWASIEPRILWASACLSLHDFDQARQHLLVAQRLNSESGRRFEPYVLRWLGLVDLRQGNLARALSYCQAGVTASFQQGDHNILASCLGLCSALAAQQGLPERAARLAGASHAMYARQKRKPWEDSSLDTLLLGWRERPDAEANSAAFDAGKAMNAEQALAYALSE